MEGSLFQRREFLRKAGVRLLAVPALPLLSRLGWAQSSAASPSSGLHKPPVPCTVADAKTIFNVRDFGATGDGETKDTAAIQQAIDRCWVLGGREVFIPAGKYLTGAIALRPNTLLRLDKDATLLGSPDFADYPVMQVRWEGRWMQGHVGLIYALNADHIGIVGPGRIIGNPALGGRPNAENPLRHPALIEPIGCNHIRLEDFSTSYHQMWSVHLTYCENVRIRKLTIRSTGGNGDGIDVDSCKHVWIDGCDIATGDDCISLKSGRGSEAFALMKTTEDVHISNCTFADSIFACIGIGSETSGGIRGVTVENCTFTSAKTFAIYIKSRIGRGAFIEDIACSNLRASGMTGGFLRINVLSSGLLGECPVPGDPGIPTVRNFRFSNIHVDTCPVLVDATRIDRKKPLEGFSFVGVTGTCGKGMYLANMRQAEIQNIHVTGYSRALLNIDNVTGVGLKGAAHLNPSDASAWEQSGAPHHPHLQ